MCIAIDSVELERAKIHLKRGQKLYINVPEILESALKIASGDAVPETQNLKVLYNSMIDPRFAVLTLKPRILSKRQIDRLHKAQIRILKSA